MENSNKVIEEIKSENRALIIQIHNLNKTLHESGTVETMRNLAETQERMSYFENLCNEVCNSLDVFVSKLIKLVFI